MSWAPEARWNVQRRRFAVVSEDLFGEPQDALRARGDRYGGVSLDGEVTLLADALDRDRADAGDAAVNVLR